jgi:predicted O-methyltransferase YrrM
MAIPTYVIRGGLQGRERLRVLSRVLWPTTSRLFDEVGIRPDARCLDLGCGGGDVTMELARLAPLGRVLGTDLDPEKIELARGDAQAAGITNIEFRTDDVMEPPADDEQYDVIYVRFLLTHLTDPAAALTNIGARLVPGGVVIVEDIDFTGHFCHPDNDSFWRYVEWYSKAVQARGADPNIGPRVPGLLRDAGFVGVSVNIVQPAGMTGDVKMIGPITLENVADAVLGAGLTTHDEFAATVDDFYSFAETEGTFISLPRIVQAWGRSPR